MCHKREKFNENTFFKLPSADIRSWGKNISSLTENSSFSVLINANLAYLNNILTLSNCLRSTHHQNCFTTHSPSITGNHYSLALWLCLFCCCLGKHKPTRKCRPRCADESLSVSACVCSSSMETLREQTAFQTAQWFNNKQLKVASQTDPGPAPVSLFYSGFSLTSKDKNEN